MTWQGVSEAECYDNRSVIAQIVRIKDRLTAVEQNVDPTLRTDLEAAIAELTALENTVANVQTAVGTNAGNITALQTDVGEIDTELAGKADTTAVDAALALKADAADVDADLDLKADKTQLTDGSVTKIGTRSVGSAYSPVYIDAGVPTQVGEHLILKQGISATSISQGGGTIPTLPADWVSIYKGKNITNDYNVCLSEWLLHYNETTKNVTAAGQVIATKKGYESKRIMGSAQIVEKRGSSNTDYEVFVRIDATMRGQTMVLATALASNDLDAVKVGSPTTGLSYYENVTYGSLDIPNVANYSQYTWTAI